MAIPLEDNFTDIIGKAQRGLGLSDSELAARAGISAEQVRALRGGDMNGAALTALAPPLGLSAPALLDLAQGKWQPASVENIDGLAHFNTPFDDMTVNAYLVWNPATREAVAFDTGSDCSEMLALVAGKKLTIKLILLTHTHGDHILELDRLTERTGAPAFVSDREPIAGASSFAEGKHFEVAGLQIDSLLTWGHSPGGTTYFVRGLARPVAIAGDSIFAGSMGGGSVSYHDAVRNNREKILTLPGETIICPGHGPLTTVAEENAHNPFFATRL